MTVYNLRDPTWWPTLNPFKTVSTVAMVESLKEVSGYLGDNVTLPSGADASWTLFKIEWSIFPNNTWIATYRGGKESIERFYRYKGRLSLNTTTGKRLIDDFRICQRKTNVILFLTLQCLLNVLLLKRWLDDPQLEQKWCHGLQRRPWQRAGTEQCQQG